MSKKKTLAKLQELENSLAMLKALPKKDEEINMFTVFHLQSAERHHSSFFAGLLAPDNPHRLGNAAIKRFLSTI